MLTDERIEQIWQATPTAGLEYIFGEPAKEFRIRFARAILAEHSAGTQTDAARDAEDAKRYRFIRSQMQVGAVQTQLPLYRSLHWIGYEDCSDVRDADKAIDAEIERIDREKGEL